MAAPWPGHGAALPSLQIEPEQGKKRPRPARAGHCLRRLP